MRSLTIAFGLSAFISASYGLQVPSYLHCPPLGPVLPAPSNPSNSSAVQQIVSTITAAFHNLTSELNGTAVSIGVTSAREDKPLLDLHFTPPAGSLNGTSKVDRNTVYRVGSISKVYAAFILMKLTNKLRWSDPVTKYVPELLELYNGQEKSAITAVDWNEVTIEALLSHLGNIPANFGFDQGNEGVDWTGYGLPALNSSEIAGCGGDPDERGCTRQEFFARFGQRHPVYAPFTTPAYTNMGYAILGFVIESVTNKTYEDWLKETVLTPLNLTRTSIATPTDENVVKSTWFGSDLGIENPSGGVYASTADLLKFGTSILNSELLTPAQTRRWLKPLSHTSSVGISVGAPWEIGRAVSLTSDNRTIDFYTKSGEVGEYVGVLALVPDYDIVLSALTAGDEASYSLVYGGLTQVVEALIPAIEQAGKEEANSTFAGQYQVKGSNSTITISVDSDGPGLKITDWLSEGHDIPEEWGVISTPAGGVPGSLSSAPGVGVRLYPTNLRAGNQSSWRAIFDTESSLASAADDDSQLFFLQGSCLTWSTIDGSIYGLRAFDDFVFTLDDKTGRAESVTPRALRETLVRV